MQAVLATAARHDRTDYWRRRARLYMRLLWAVGIAGILLLLGVLARNYGWGGDFADSQWGHLLFVVLPLVTLLVPTTLAMISAEDQIPLRPILLGARRTHPLPIPASCWPATNFKRPPRVLPMAWA